MGSPNPARLPIIIHRDPGKFCLIPSLSPVASAILLGAASRCLSKACYLYHLLTS
jgi:hypothetical protein